MSPYQSQKTNWQFYIYFLIRVTLLKKCFSDFESISFYRVFVIQFWNQAGESQPHTTKCSKPHTFTGLIQGPRQVFLPFYIGTSPTAEVKVVCWLSPCHWGNAPVHTDDCATFKLMTNSYLNKFLYHRKQVLSNIIFDNIDGYNVEVKQSLGLFIPQI